MSGFLEQKFTVQLFKKSVKSSVVLILAAIFQRGQMQHSLLEGFEAGREAFKVAHFGVTDLVF